MVPSADKLYGDADFIFQQDVAPANTAKSTKTWLNNRHITVIDWPVNFPDLNPIENLWGIVKRKMRHESEHCSRAAIKASWYSRTLEQCHRLMPHHIEAVICAKAGQTKYQVLSTYARLNLSEGQ